VILALAMLSKLIEHGVSIVNKIVARTTEPA
jgi:hypothetical protein